MINYQLIPSLYAWFQSVGISLASRYSLCKSNGETAHHLLFTCPFAIQHWSWVLRVLGLYMPLSLYVASYQRAFSASRDVSTRMIIVLVFFHLISSFWFTWNEATFNGNLRSRTRFQHMFLQRLKKKKKKISIEESRQI